MRVQPDLILRKVVVTIPAWQYAWTPIFMTVCSQSGSATLIYIPSSAAIEVYNGLLLPSQCPNM